MDIFKNFIFALAFIGVFTRIALYFYSKTVKKNIAVFFTFVSTGVILLPFVSIFIGFDIAISEYLVSLIIWLLFDLMRVKIDIKRIKK